jgi:predicted MFS family arabinose efflux permease
VTILLLGLAVFLVQSGFHGYTATLPLALSRGGVPDAGIGLIVGMAALVQVPAAVVGGRLVDRFGGGRLFAAGGLAYLAGSLILAIPGVEPEAGLAPFVVARLCQGAGIALTLPSALSLVPSLVPAVRQANGLSVIGAAGNLTLVVMPPLSLAVLDAAGLHAVAAMVAGLILSGLLVFWRLRLRTPPRPAGAGVATRRWGIVFRRAWGVPLLITVLYVAHWGAVTAYLPVRAEGTGADIGLYFAADGVAVFLMRLPTAWLAERFTSRTLIAVGAVLTAVAIGMLLLPLTTPLLIASGLLGGGASAAVLSPVLFEVNRRSTDIDRGSAFALYSGAIAGAISLGSIGGAPIVALFGLSAALAGGIALILGSLGLALADPSLRRRSVEAAGPGHGPERDVEAAPAR